MFRQGRVIVGGQLGHQGRAMFRANVARARPARTRFRRKGVRRRQVHVLFDGGESDGKAFRHHLWLELLVNDGVDNAFAEIKRIRFHSERLPPQRITLQETLVGFACVARAFIPGRSCRADPFIDHLTFRLCAFLAPPD